ncbi:MAG: heparinase II/III domain-containing protein [Planctomycetota bacterium]
MKTVRQIGLPALALGVVLCGLVFGMSRPITLQGPEGGIDKGRINAIAGALAEKPACFGRPISDRAAWEKLAKKQSFQEVISEAEELLKEAIPELPDELYLDYSRTGNRSRWERVNRRRRSRLKILVLAECLENKRRFLAGVEDIITAHCAERSWLYPAHDHELTNFEGTYIYIDLASATLAAELATADYLLGAKLNGKTRRLIRENINRRILEPFRDEVTGKREARWWLTKPTNNWNSVCLAGVTGSALAMLESRQERALFAAAAEKYSKNFLVSYTPDGYCTEGVSYWSYGYRNYILLAEAMYQATGGKLDLMDVREARPAAMYAARAEIINGIYPTFSDCSINARPYTKAMWYVNRRFKLGLDEWEKEDIATPSGSRQLYEIMMYSFSNSASQMRPAEKAFKGTGPRTWFEDGGVLICRPSEKYRCQLAVAMKGGHNNEQHNHNDVGSYMIVLGQSAPLIDPGSEVYTKRTFSARRYESNVINSYGHPVPVVAGKLQSTGKESHGRVVRTEFSDETDTLVLDISSAYDTGQLKKLERTFVYSRKGAGSLTVTDEVELGKPESFETVLITLGRWKRLDDNSLLIEDGGKAVRVDIETAGGFDIEEVQIKEDMRDKRLPTRIAIKLKEPVTKAAVIMRITPSD